MGLPSLRPLARRLLLHFDEAAAAAVTSFAALCCIDDERKSNDQNPPARIRPPVRSIWRERGSAAASTEGNKRERTD